MEPSNHENLGVSKAPSATPGDTRSNQQLRIFAYGSCVSRDAFQELDAPILVDYFARSCIGSAFSAPRRHLESISLESNPSAFQRRMVRTDLSKDLEAILLDSEFDLLLVDFIDERLHLIRSTTGYDTYSPELSRTGFEVDPELLVEPGSDEYMSAFRSGWEKLLELVPAQRIVVSRAFWATHDETRAELSDPTNIARNNNVLERLYDYACSTPGVRVIDYTNDELTADSIHKWGISPFHYSKAFYRKTVEFLSALEIPSDQDLAR